MHASLYAAGLLLLIGGVVTVNVASGPRAAQGGTIIAGIGVLILALAAAGTFLS